MHLEPNYLSKWITERAFYSTNWILDFERSANDIILRVTRIVILSGQGRGL